MPRYYKLLIISWFQLTWLSKQRGSVLFLLALVTLVMAHPPLIPHDRMNLILALEGSYEVVTCKFSSAAKLNNTWAEINVTSDLDSLKIPARDPEK